MDPVVAGLALILTPTNLLLIILGVTLGVIVGILPGLSSPMAIALLLPFTMHLDTVPAIAMLVALYCAGTFSGSITAILINAPGTPPSFATTLDGYPMARSGQAGRALGLATVASVFGGCFSVAVVALAVPLFIGGIAFLQPPDYFGIHLFALAMLANVGGKSILRNLISGALGMLLATVGVHFATGITRFTFDQPILTAGIPLVPVLIGLFAISEVIRRSGGVGIDRPSTSKRNLELPNRSDIVRLKGTALRASGIGTMVGIIPGEGATVAAMLAYEDARQRSAQPDRFGQGCAEGVVAPEAANNAATGGAMVPTLALGIPGSASTALIITAFVAHGVWPGPSYFEEQPQILYALLGAMLLANLTFLGVGMIGARILPLVMRLKPAFIWPATLALSLMGAYAYGTNVFDIWIALAFGVVGFFLQRHGFAAAPMVMGLILGKLVEESFSQTMIMYDDNLGGLIERPVLLVSACLAVAVLLLPMIRRARGR